MKKQIPASYLQNKTIFDADVDNSYFDVGKLKLDKEVDGFESHPLRI